LRNTGVVLCLAGCFFSEEKPPLHRPPEMCAEKLLCCPVLSSPGRARVTAFSHGPAVTTCHQLVTTLCPPPRPAKTHRLPCRSRAHANPPPSVQPAQFRQRREVKRGAIGLQMYSPLLQRFLCFNIFRIYGSRSKTSTFFSVVLFSILIFCLCFMNDTLSNAAELAKAAKRFFGFPFDTH